MNFAPQKRIAVARTTGFVVSSRPSSRRFQFTSPLPETSSVFSTTSELFARFCSARHLFSTICGLFCQKMGGGVPRPGFFSQRMPVTPNAGFGTYVWRVTFLSVTRQLRAWGGGGLTADAFRLRRRVVPSFQLHMRHARLSSATSRLTVHLK